MYTVNDYGSMIADDVRMNAYAESLKRTIDTNSVVLDIGTGTGILAMLACKFGACRVYAIETNDAIHLARAMANANNLLDKIVFVQGLSTQLSLPEQANVIVSDLRGQLPFYGHHISTIVDARERLLAKEGILIPHQDSLWVAIVSAQETYNHYTAPWNKFDLNMQLAQQIVLNTWSNDEIKVDGYLTSSKQWASIDYTSVTKTDVIGSVTTEVNNPGIGHGLLIWFNTKLHSNIGFSNHPAEKQTKVYGRGFFPWLKPVELNLGDTISVDIRADLVHDDYVWRWNTIIFAGNDDKNIKAKFEQSTFYSETISVTHWRKRASNYIPQLNHAGEITLHTLEMMNGEVGIEEIAYQLLKTFPNDFQDLHTTIAYVGKLARDYSR